MRTSSGGVLGSARRALSLTRRRAISRPRSFGSSAFSSCSIWPGVKVFGVEAVFAGVLVAGLTAAFALGRFVLVALFFFIATEIVE